MLDTKMIIDRLIVVKIDATIWGGRKKLQKDDLKLADGSVLPPEELASLGSKKIADPKELAIFNRLKKEAERICLKVGSRFIGGFAVPEGSIDSVLKQLEVVSMKFESAKTDYLARYDEAIEEWVNKHPGFASVIRTAVEPVEVVAAGLRFDYVIFRVTHPDRDDVLVDATKQVVNDSLNRKVNTISDNLFKEIAQEAKELLDQSLFGKNSVTRKALSPLKRMRDKLDGLAFLDNRVQPIVDRIDELLDRAPATGALEGSFLNEIIATSLLLSDPERVKQHGSGLLSDQTIDEPDNDDEDDFLSTLLPVMDSVGKTQDLVSIFTTENGDNSDPQGVTTVPDSVVIDDSFETEDEDDDLAGFDAFKASRDSSIHSNEPKVEEAIIPMVSDEEFASLTKPVPATSLVTEEFWF